MLSYSLIEEGILDTSKIAKIAKPLTHFLKKNVPFNLDEKAQIVFEALRDIISFEALPQFSNLLQPFLVTIAASISVLKTVLSHGLISKDILAAYAFRTLNQPKTHYFTIKN